MDSETLQELLRSPLDDIPRRAPFRLRADHVRGLATALLVVAGVVLFAGWVRGGITDGLRDAVHPRGSVRVRVPPLDLQALTADPSTGRLVMMGGRSLSGAAHPEDLSDQTWQYADGSWWWLRADGPSARQGHALAFDVGDGVAVLFGGSATRYDPCVAAEWCGHETLGDTWTFSPAEGTWTLHRPEAGPSPRFGHAAAYDPTTGHVILFGGATLEDGTTTVLDDTWAFDAATATWERLPTPTAPSPRAHHAMATDPDGGVLLLGGYGPSVQATDLWRFDGTSWTLVDDDLGIGIRSMSAAAFDGGTLVVFGGTGRIGDDVGTRFFDDVLAVDPAAGTVSAMTPFPETLWRHGAVTDPQGDGIVVVVRDRTLRYRLAADTWDDLTASRVPVP